jgi:hypothetical protein
MNIHTVAENLRNTIAGKEKMLASHTKYLQSSGTHGAENMAIHATVEFLKINLIELGNILADVEGCLPTLSASAREQLEEQGWQG